MHRAPFSSVVSRKHQDTVNRKLQVRVMVASSTAPAPWTCPNLMPPPPISTPMSQMSSCSSQSQDPFKVCFKVGNVAVCNRCWNTFSRADTIIVQHAEFLHFDSPCTGLLASKYGYVYYHLNRKCIELTIWNLSSLHPRRYRFPGVQYCTVTLLHGLNPIVCIDSPLSVTSQLFYLDSQVGCI